MGLSIICEIIMSYIITDDVFFEECIMALGENVTILDKPESNKIWTIFKSHIPIIKGGSRIDWKQIDRKSTIDIPTQTFSTLKKLLPNLIDTSVCVLWNDALLPVIKTNIESVIAHFDDVTAVCFETWLYNPEQKYIVEFYYLGEMSAGLVPFPLK